MRFSTICVIGTGLIGGSLLLSLRRQKIGERLIAVDLPETIQRLEKMGIVDETYSNKELAGAVENADLIFVATQISLIEQLLPEIARHARPGAVISDVGSSKRRIVEIAAQVFSSQQYFVGGHPMAGSEKSGFDAADPFLFENCFYILTPQPKTPNDIIENLADLLAEIGAKILVLDSATHDRIAAGVSHLPQMLAVSLVNFINRCNEQQPHFLQLAAGGFRDMTRIASSPFAMWEDICRTNDEQILSFLDQFIDYLSEFRNQFEINFLKKQFEDAARIRLSIPRDTKGFINPNYDIAVVVDDKPGVIARMATVLAEHKINIRDIEVLKVRLLEGGTIRLSFETKQDREDAMKLLRGIGFECRKR
ncbi:MAG: prephenate dehydrogenase [Calditrichaeota bacterium]|nr:prephenate dehydrogenase [Calditrichota bacterium]